MNPSRLDNARFWDRQLAEEALERNLLSCKFTGIFSMRTSYSTVRMIDYAFQKSAILKLPKLVTCPSLAYDKSPRGKEVEGGTIKKGSRRRP